MLRKWKLILTNWINCYHDENKKQCVTLDSLLTIITHLHENLNLDESKTSTLEAHTIEEFLVEKFPEFKFENETTGAANEDEVYIIASLLLFFVCISSKNVDIKTAMCSKLSQADQESILKFTKCLMECTSISHGDVQAAITEACGQDVASSGNGTSHVTVAETPPALRSLHGEVRRLQAALDAEKFDRNYLQEELARTNLRLEKLLKDKEKCKLEIVNLKAKISLCCGQEADDREGDANADRTAKLTRQLEDLEERLVATQEKLDDAQYERDVFKAKIDELKQERDKWMEISHQETSRACQLAEELETERRNVHSLRELLTDLRQHQQKTCLDSSQLECDNPDVSIHSLQSTSVCSEACANVVEVQLAEERAQIVDLKQQVQTLQDQLNELNLKAENEKQSLERIISKKDDDIFNLKHRINEEIEEKNKLASHYNDEFIRLNNEINELEQKLKDSNESSRLIIEKKMHEVQVLQEEKLSLLQSLSDETTKLEAVIKDLRADIETEKNLRLKMKEDYENHIMKMNEKILNRNNELVELQNNIFEKSEIIEQLHLDLRGERELREQLANKYHTDVATLTKERMAIEHTLHQKSEESKELQRRLQQNVLVFEEFNKEIDELKLANTQLSENLDERNATINTLQMQLQDEINYKSRLQNELIKLDQAKTNLSDEVKQLNIEISNFKKDNHDKDRIIYAIDLYLKEEKHTNKLLKQDCDKKSEEITKLFEEISAKDKEITSLQDKLETDTKFYTEELQKRDAMIEEKKVELSSEIKERDSLQSILASLANEKDGLNEDLTQRCEEMAQLQADYEKLSQVVENNNQLINTMEEKLEVEKSRYMELENNFTSQTSNLMAKLNDTEKMVKEYDTIYRNTVEEKELQVQTLKHEFEKLQKIIDNGRSIIEKDEKEKYFLTMKLDEEISYRNEIEMEYQNHCAMLDDITSRLNEEIALKNEELSDLKNKVESLLKTVAQKSGEVEKLQEDLQQEKQTTNEISNVKNLEIEELQKRINELSALCNNLELGFNEEISNKTQIIQALEKDNEQLHIAMEEDDRKHELIINDKCVMIEILEERFRMANTQLESLQKDYADEKSVWQNIEKGLGHSLEAKEKEVRELQVEVSELKRNLEDAENLKIQIEDIIKENNETDLMRKEHVNGLIAEIKRYEKQLCDSELAIIELKNLLGSEKSARDAIEMEKNTLSKQNETLMNELQHEHSVSNILNEEKKSLESEKMMITQELVEERSVRQLAEQEKQALLTEKELITQQLNDEIAVKDELAKENDNLAQQLMKEKATKDHIEQEKGILQSTKDMLEQKINNLLRSKGNLEQEKKNLIEDKSELIKEINNLNLQLIEEASVKDYLQEERQKLNEMLEDEKLSRGEIFNEKECLLDENESLKHNVIELKAIQDALVTDKEMLGVEKERLLKSLDEEKAARDEMESEKNSASVKLDELEEKYATELKEINNEMANIAQELKHLKLEVKNHEDEHAQIFTVLNNGLDKLLQNISREDISNTVLEKLSNVGDYALPTDKCHLLISVAEDLMNELTIRKNLEKVLEEEDIALKDKTEMIRQKEAQLSELQTEIKRLEQVVQDSKFELTKQMEIYNTSMESKQLENQSLHNELNNVKVQLEVKVHSLKEKLIENENLTDKLKETYECQIDNLNVMITKLTGYLKDKTAELESVRKEHNQLQQVVEDNNKVIKSLEDEVKSEKQNQKKLISDFESERLVLKNMVTITESVMEDQRVSLNKVISEHLKTNETLQEKYKALQEVIDTERKNSELKLQEKHVAFEAMFKDLSELRNENERIQNELRLQKGNSNKEVASLKKELNDKITRLGVLEAKNKDLAESVTRYKADVAALEKKENELKHNKDSLEFELLSDIDKLTKVLKDDIDNKNDKLKCILQNKLHSKHDIQAKVKVLSEVIIDLVKENGDLERERISTIDKMKSDFNLMEAKANEEINKLKKDNLHLVKIIEENKNVISNLEQLIKHELEQNRKLHEDTANEKLNLENKCSLLQEQQNKAEKQIEEKDKEIATLKESFETANANATKHYDSVVKNYQASTEKLKEDVATLKSKLNIYELDIKEKDDMISRLIQQKDSIISTLNNELMEERAKREKYQNELQLKATSLYELRQQLEGVKKEVEMFELMRNDKKETMTAVGQSETSAASSQEKSPSQKRSNQAERELRDRHQVSTPTSDLTQSSMDSIKTISDLEKIIQDKNRTITTLQSDVTYLKSLMAESENKLLDVTKDLEVSKENCQQLSNQLKKMVHQKNEEIAELKKQLNRMSVTENRASQIIKVSAKYQAIILKRIAEIKSNTILKELTNFGNASNCDNELKRSLTSGTITMEDLENFLETTDRHLKRCSEKQIILQKERDRLIEVNRIHESEILNLKKFLTELSISFKTFSSVKEIYAQKLSRVVSVQRTVRREILHLEGLINDPTMCKLERGYAAVMQDLSECAMNLERWVERCIGRTISPEKIKQAFTSDNEQASLGSMSFQNTGLEVQLEELENSFQKLLEEVARAQKGEGVKDAQAVTVMEVRAEYEDKLNRMKAKMKQLYQEQIAVFKEEQKKEISILERELKKAQDKLTESSRAYEQHIKALTTELWSVGEKFLMKKDEAEWLRKKQRSGSLMSLQHVHSSSLVPPLEDPGRPSDSHSLRSLPIHNHREPREGRGLHMSDEEGEVFDNRYLKELSDTPRRETIAPGQRLSELRWRNSLCPPHLKSSYPAETQFVHTFDEDDIKFAVTTEPGRQQRKEVGITAYKKPGPPTPSKQAGRLSATDSELRESLRVNAEPQPGRKTSTPSRIRALFRSRNDTDGTPRSRRLSNIFRKK